MAMNKKERVAFDAMAQQLREARSLRFSEKSPGPDVEIPQGGAVLSRGWDAWANITVNARAERACSSYVHHGIGWERTTAQNPKRLYSTRLLALRAVRNELERDCAFELARIDKWIEDEIANPTTGPKS